MKPSSGGNSGSIDFVVPGDITTPTGGYIYDREIVAGLAERGEHGFAEGGLADQGNPHQVRSTAGRSAPRSRAPRSRARRN